MSPAFKLSPKNRRSLQLEMQRETYALMTPIDKTLALARNPRLYSEVLGADWYALTGVDRLYAVSITATSLYPLNPVETLVACAVEPQQHVDALQMHFPDIQPDQWKAALAIGGLHHNADSHKLPENQQLALYQWAAWNTTLGVGLHPDTGANIEAWEAAPECVRMDPMMQQIVAIKCPVVLQECIRRSPKKVWNSRAIGLSLKQTSISPQVPWYTLMDNATFEMLMVDSLKEHLVLGRSEPHLYDFPLDKLPTLRNVHPALFLHGVLHNKTLRESSVAKEWFVPMLEAVFLKTLDNSAYIRDLLAPQDLGAAMSHRFDVVLEQFAPQYMLLLPAYQSVHLCDVAYTRWAKACAQAVQNPQETFLLPELDMEGQLDHAALRE